MSGLGSVSERDILQRLRREGWVCRRRNGGHDHWFHDKYPHRRVTTAPASMSKSGNVRRNIFRQAGWSWIDRDANEDLKKICRNVQQENEALRRSLHEILEMVDAFTSPY